MAQEKGRANAMVHASIFAGAVASIWAAAAFLSGMAQVNWEFSELLRQYLVAIGVMQEHHTFVDFYTHIKGVEYIIALFFLSAFPFVFRYLDRAADESSAA